MPHLVITRSQAPLDWLSELPAGWRVSVFNAGEAWEPRSPGRPVQVMDATAGLDEVGQRVEAVLRTVAATRSGARAEPTVFAPEAPFSTCPVFLDLLAQQAHFAAVQPLSCGPHGRTARSQTDQRDWLGDLPVRAERFSLASLAPLSRCDEAATRAGRAYRRKHRLAEGTGLLAHFMSLAGLDALADQAAQADIGLMAEDGLFAVSAAALSRAANDWGSAVGALQVLARADRNYPELFERSWLHLFGLPFVALEGLGRALPQTDVRHAPALSRAVAAIDAVLAQAAPAPSGLSFKAGIVPAIEDATRTAQQDRRPAAETAAPLLAAPLEAVDDNLDTVLGHISRALARSHVAAAWAWVDEGLARWPQALPLLAAAMRLAHDQGDVHRALNGARRVLAVDPQHLDALFTLGMSLAATGETEEAMNVLARVGNHPDAADWQRVHPQAAEYLQAARTGRPAAQRAMERTH